MSIFLEIILLSNICLFSEWGLTSLSYYQGELIILLSLIFLIDY